MKISTTRATITLGRRETLDCEGMLGVNGETRSQIRKDAKRLADRLGCSVEIYSCAARGSYLIDRVDTTEQDEQDA